MRYVTIGLLAVMIGSAASGLMAFQDPPKTDPIKDALAEIDGLVKKYKKEQVAAGERMQDAADDEDWGGVRAAAKEVQLLSKIIDDLEALENKISNGANGG